MHTNEPVTRCVTIAAPPAAVLDLVGDGASIPRWAPAFGRAVQPAGAGEWLVDDGEQERRVRVRVSRELGTVDFLAPAAQRGAFGRVVPNGAGSEFVFTVFLPAGTGEDARAAQGAVLDEELATVRALCEG
jgi:hypothetical protein